MKFTIFTFIAVITSCVAQFPPLTNRVPTTYTWPPPAEYLRASTTFQHGPTVTTCPCYEPIRSDSGIMAFTTTIYALRSCPRPKECSNVPQCTNNWLPTLYRERCPQQVHTASVKDPQPCRYCLDGYPLKTTLTKPGVGPTVI
jgi:hypothetical protein